MKSQQYEQIAQQLLRALRGKRSQAVFSRRIGFRSNVAAKWESGQRMPSAALVLGYSRLLGNDPRPALAAFLPNAAAALGSAEELDVCGWLKALRGNQLLAAISERSGLSRYSVGRFLSGQSAPRLPQFLALVDALTARLEDLIEGWVGVVNVPVVKARFDRSRAARDALFQRPLCLAVMCLLDTRPLRVPTVAQVTLLASTLDVTHAVVKDCLKTLVEGGVVRRVQGRYSLSGSLTVDARSTPEEESQARSYWTEVAHRRASAPVQGDLCSYNVFSVGRQDFEKLRELQREFYRGARALIAASEPTDIAALLVVQLVTWNPEGA